MSTAPRRRRAAQVADDGSAAVELAVVAPVTIAIMLALVQLLFWGLGGLAAQAAAGRAAQTARTTGGSPAAGQAEAAATLDHLANQFLTDPTISVERDPNTTTVTVTATARGLPLPIRVTVEVPTERLTTPDGASRPVTPNVGRTGR